MYNDHLHVTKSNFAKFESPVFGCTGSPAGGDKVWKKEFFKEPLCIYDAKNSQDTLKNFDGLLENLTSVMKGSTNTTYVPNIRNSFYLKISDDLKSGQLHVLDGSFIEGEDRFSNLNDFLDSFMECNYSDYLKKNSSMMDNVVFVHDYLVGQGKRKSSSYLGSWKPFEPANY